MPKSILRACLFALAFLMAPAWADSADDPIKVKVQKNGDTVIIDLTTVVAATPQEVWDVLTDFDHMTQFLPNLEMSKVLEKNGDVWSVEQKGRTSHAGFTFSFQTTKQITLKAFDSIQSHLTGGTLKKHESLTTLAPEGNGTRITYHAESISGVWVPPLLGSSVVEGEVRKQYQDMTGEMLKRKAAHAAN
ncbi:MAG: SRPBCC family protein [Burkholderiaceae bacterium]|nr:SRPBCC family protein [Burkholderiaceae bacterium]